MGMWARIKSIAGGDRTNYTLAAATTINVPDDSNLFYLTGTATCTALVANSATRNRIVTFVQSDSGTTTLTNTNDTATANLMDLGGSNLALGQTDSVDLLLRADGSWLRISSVNN